MNESHTPLISVIMSVHNEEKYVEESVRSILNQTISDFEFIIIDDYSTDRTYEIIDSINDSRIVLLKNDTNLGLTRTLNKALALSKGKFIARMDGDDISLPRRFEKQLEYLENHEDVMLISANTITIGDINLVSEFGGSPEEMKCKMLLRPQLNHPSFMFRADLYRKYGYLYDEYFIAAQDYDFAARVASSFNIGVTKEYLLQYRTHNAQVSSTMTGKQFGYADEIRKRLLKEIGLELNASEYEAYQKWVLEISNNRSEYLDNYSNYKKIVNANKITKVYDIFTLEKALKKQYFKYVIRSGGSRCIGSICGVNICEYITFFNTLVEMTFSKIKRKFVKN